MVEVYARHQCLAARAKEHAHNGAMKFLYFLADAFINTFGITRPTEKARRQAAFFILALLLLALCAAFAAALIVHSVMH